MKATSAIRAERAQVRKDLAESKRRVRELTAEDKVLTAALKVLGGDNSRRRAKAAAPSTRTRTRMRSPLTDAENDRKVLSAMQSEPGRSWRQARIMEVADLASATVSRSLRRLADQGLVEKLAPSLRSPWRLTPKGKPNSAERRHVSVHAGVGAAPRHHI